MNGPDISAALDCQSLSVWQRGQEPCMAMQKAMEVCFIPSYVIYHIMYNKWCICLNRTCTAFKDENHTAYILCSLPTKLAEWLGNNHGDKLGIPALSHADWWQVGELYANYAILDNNLVPGKAAHLRTL
jgi:hypothetical protein